MQQNRRRQGIEWVQRDSEWFSVVLSFRQSGETRDELI
jgi:hypothetical protein